VSFGGAKKRRQKHTERIAVLKSTIEGDDVGMG